MAKINIEKLKNLARSLKEKKEQDGAVKKSGEADKEPEVHKKKVISSSKASGRKN